MKKLLPVSISLLLFVIIGNTFAISKHGIYNQIEKIEAEQNLLRFADINKYDSYWTNSDVNSQSKYLGLANSHSSGVMANDKTPIFLLATSNLEAAVTQCNGSNIKQFTIENRGQGKLIYEVVSVLPGWIKPSTYIGTINPGDSTIVNIEFNAKKLNAGNYSFEIIINSNDPVNTADTVNCIFKVEGQPSIETSVMDINFGDVIIYGENTNILTLTNTGCDTLKISDLIFTSDLFKTNNSVFEILPGDSYNMPISFNPTINGNSSGTLTVVNNDINVIINLNGKGIPGQVLSVDKKAIDIVITQSPYSGTQQFTIENTGINKLKYNIRTEFYDDFENGLDKWNLLTNNWGITNNAYEGNGALTESPNGNYGIEWSERIELKEPVKVIDAKNCHLSFWLLHNLTKEDWNRDYVEVEISVNNGRWRELDYFEENRPWRFMNYDLSDYVNSGDMIQVAFKFRSYNLTTSDGVVIDNLKITLGKPDWLNFSTYSGTLNSGNSQNIDVSFDATGIQNGVYQYDIIIESNDEINKSDTVLCAMTVNASPIIEIAKTVFNFGNVFVNAIKTDTLTIKNSGSDTLKISDISNLSSIFTIDKKSLSILPYNSDEVVITFLPTSEGNVNDTLTIVNNDANVKIKLSGTGITAPVLSLNTLALEAASVHCNGKDTMQFAIENTGGNNLNYEIQPTLPNWINIINKTGSIQPGGVQTINVVFNAENLQKGVHNYAIIVKSNDPVNTADTVSCAFTVHGVPSITVSESEINFGETILTYPVTKIVTITNMGCDTLKVSEILSSSEVFTVDTDLVNILGGESYDVTVSFNPLNKGTESGILTITNNGINKFINLSGTGLSPELSVNRDTIEVTIPFDKSVIRNFVIENTGNSELKYKITGTEFYDDFENGLNKWNIISGQWGIIDGYQSEGALTESPGGSYGKNWDHYIEQKMPIRIYNAQNCQLSFWIKSSLSYRSDYLYAQICVNNGQWHNVMTFGRNQNSGGVLKIVDLSEYVKEGDLLKMRFRFISDQGWQGDGVSIDNIKMGSPIPGWISLSNNFGTINPGGSQDFELKFISDNMNKGVYRSNILIHTNNLVNFTDSIICKLTVEGTPVLLISKTDIDFGDTLLYGIKTDTLKIFNNGRDSLKISEFISTNDVFTVSFESVNILPNDSIDIIISFKPTTVGNSIGTLTIVNNHANIDVNLSGTGLPAPVISITPTTLDTTAQCSKIVNKSFTVENNGDSQLLYSIQTETNFYDDFENGLDKWNLITDNWGIVSDSYEGNGALTESPNGNYGYNWDKYIELKEPVTVIYAKNCILSYRFNAAELASWDYIHTQISVNNAAWIDLSKVGTNNGWTLKTFNLSPYVNDRDLIKIRFRFTSNISPYNVGNGIRIDNFKITSSLNDWINLPKNTGTLNPGENEKLNVVFNAETLNKGLYKYKLIVNSNDLRNTPDTINCNFTVKGTSSISLSTNSLDFGETIITTLKPHTIVIFNTGCDTLNITDISGKLAEYTVNIKSTTILPGDSVNLMVSFTPTSAEDYKDTLTIVNNDADINITVSGSGILPPVLSINTDTIKAMISACEEVDTVSFTIENTGNSELSYEIETYFYDNFENGMQNWEVISGFWGIGNIAYQSNGALTESPNGNYGKNWRNHYVELKNPVQVYDAKNCELSFWRYCSFVGYHNGLSIHISVNNGGWIHLGSWHWSKSIWVLESYNLSSYLEDGDMLNVRFTFYSTSKPTAEGCSIDNFKITSANLFEINILDYLGTVSPGSSKDIKAVFSANNLTRGVYSCEMLIKTNEPVNSSDTFFCIFKNQGKSDITISKFEFNFGDVLLNGTVTDTLVIYNTGCDTLKIDNINSLSGMVAVNIKSIDILPGDSVITIVSFTPTSEGVISDKLTIVSNDGNIDINVNGTGLPSPQLSVNTYTLESIVAKCPNTETQQFTIENKGSTDLIFEIEKEIANDIFDDFENGLEKWDKITNRWGIINGGPDGSGVLTESPAGNYGINWNETIMLRGPIRVLHAVDCQVSYDLKSRIHKYHEDFLYTRIRVNNGSWQTIETITGDIEWSKKTFDLSGYVNDGDTLDFRFNFTSNSGWASDGISIDNFKLTSIVNTNSGIELSTYSGIIEPGKTQQINVEFNTRALNNGIYDYYFYIKSNDVGNPKQKILVKCIIEGTPFIIIPKTNINVGDTLLYGVKTDTLTIFNYGCSLLKISNLSLTSGMFTVDKKSVDIQSGDSANVIITFIPTGEGIIRDTLTIVNNDVNVEINLSGTGLSSPAISFNTTHLETGFSQCNGTESKQFTIENTGTSELVYSIEPEFYDDFENGLSKWNLITNNWGITDDTFQGAGALTESPDGDYGYNWNKYIQLKETFTVINAENCLISYWIRGDVDWNDWLHADIQVNGGEWQIISKYNSDEHRYDWSLKAFNLSKYVSDGDILKLRFRFTSNFRYNGRGISLDNLRITAIKINEMDLSAYSGIINPGGTNEIRVNFNANGLGKGVYNNKFEVYSNDLGNTKESISYKLTIDGTPSITSENELNFGNVFVNDLKIDTLTITNSGCDTLKISKILSSSVLFTVESGPVNIATGQSYKLLVSFIPTANEFVNDSLTIINNDTKKVIKLTGTGIIAPVLSLSTFILESTATQCDQSIIKQLIIENTGGNELKYSVENTFYDDFENGLDKWNLITDNWGIEDFVYEGKGALTESPGGRYGDNWDKIIEIKEAFTAVNPYKCYLSYWLLTRVEGYRLRDYMATEISVNSGSWKEIDKVSGNTGWNLKTFNLSSYLKKGDDFRIRLRFISDNSMRRDGVSVDNFKITSVSSKWMGFSNNLSGIIVPGASEAINISFNAETQNNGVYHSNFVVKSNDPLNDKDTVSCTFRVNGNPSISALSDFYIGDALINETITKKLEILNSGCDTLKITDIISSSVLFMVKTKSVNILQGETFELPVFFTPNTYGELTGSLKVISNDSDYTINVKGIGVVSKLVAVSTKKEDGSYKAGDEIDLIVTFNKNININTTSGKPELKLNIVPVANADYLEQVTSTSLLFQYKIGTGDNSALLDYTSKNDLTLGGAIIQASGINASIILPRVGTFSENHKIAIDNTIPDVELLSKELGLTNKSPITVSINFSEIITGFHIDSIKVSNGTVGNLQVTVANKEYTVEITPSGEGDITVNIEENVVKDLSGFSNTASNQLTFNYDITAPEVVISSTETGNTNKSPIPVLIVFSEIISGFELNNITVSNGKPGNLQEIIAGKEFTFDITPMGDRKITVYIDENVVTDLAGNNNTVSNQLGINYNGTPPVVILSSLEPDNTRNSPMHITIFFSKRISGFNINDITLINSTAGNLLELVENKKYTIEITPSSEGDVQIVIEAGVTEDLFGNGNQVSNNLKINYDITKPGIEISSTISGGTNKIPIIATIVFSESVTGFNINDITTINCTTDKLQELVANKEYSVELSPVSEGEIKAYIENDVVLDFAGNSNTASNQLTIKYDITAPELTSIELRNITYKSASANVISNENGFVYSLITSDANKIVTNKGILLEKEYPVESGIETQIDYENLSENTTYLVYFIVKDEQGNISDIYTKEFTTIINGIDGIKIGNIIIYPNPTSGILHLNSVDEIIEEVKLINILGQVVYINKPGILFKTIDITELAKGLYLLQLQTEKGIITTRIVLK